MHYLLPAACMLLSFLVWDTDWFYPVKLFTVMLHEVSHGLAAWFSGGTVKEIQVTMQLGGNCIIDGGNQSVIASVGYPGSLLAGAGLYYSAFRPHMRRYFSFFLAVLLLLFMSMYVRDTFGILSVLGTSAMFLFLPMALPEKAAGYYGRVTGSLVLAYCIIDMYNDLFAAPSGVSDIQVLASGGIVHPFILSLFYIILAAAVVLLAVRYSPGPHSL